MDMNLLQMSISATILILVIMGIRALTIHKLPKKTFLVLWVLVLLRLLIPFAIPMPIDTHIPFSVQAIMDRVAESATSTADIQTAAPYIETMPTTPATPIIVPNTDEIYAWEPVIAPETAMPEAATVPETATPQIASPEITAPQGTEHALPQISSHVPPIMIIWFVGMIGFALFFLVTHLRCRREYKAALPIESDYIDEWLQDQNLKRSVQVRFLDKISTPMTYGIFRPVILFPKNTDWQNKDQLQYVLTHEITHIRRFDILTKWLLTAALCIHWFNPLVWVMYILANRDIEVSCDEAVVWTFGETKKSAYAMALIGLEENRHTFSPLFNSFAKNSIKERINAIMKLKKRSVMNMALAVVLVSAMVIGTLIVSAQTNEYNPDAVTQSDASYISEETIAELEIQLATLRENTEALVASGTFTLEEITEVITLMEEQIAQVREGYLIISEPFEFGENVLSVAISPSIHSADNHNLVIAAEAGVEIPEEVMHSIRQHMQVDIIYENAMEAAEQGVPSYGNAFGRLNTNAETFPTSKAVVNNGMIAWGTIVGVLGSADGRVQVSIFPGEDNPVAGRVVWIAENKWDFGHFGENPEITADELARRFEQMEMAQRAQAEHRFYQIQSAGIDELQMLVTDPDPALAAVAYRLLQLRTSPVAIVHQDAVLTEFSLRGTSDIVQLSVMMRSSELSDLTPLTGTEEIEWHSSDTNVFTVTSLGGAEAQIEAVGFGTAYLSVFVDGAPAESFVRVMQVRRG